MYDAEVRVRKVLKLIIEREKFKMKAIGVKSRGEAEEFYDKIMRASAKIIRDIKVIWDDFRILKRPFIYNKVDYIENMVDELNSYKQIFEEEH